MLRAANRTGLHGTVFFLLCKGQEKGREGPVTFFSFGFWKGSYGSVRPLGSFLLYPVSVFKNISKCMYMYVRLRCSVPKIAHRPRWPVILTLRASSRVPLQSTNESELIRSLPHWHVKLDASKIRECWEDYRTKTIDTSRGKGNKF